MYRGMYSACTVHVQRTHATYRCGSGDGWPDVFDGYFLFTNPGEANESWSSQPFAAVSATDGVDQAVRIKSCRVGSDVGEYTSRLLNPSS